MQVFDFFSGFFQLTIGGLLSFWPATIIFVLLLIFSFELQRRRKNKLPRELIFFLLTLLLLPLISIVISYLDLPQNILMGTAVGLFGLSVVISIVEIIRLKNFRWILTAIVGLQTIIYITFTLQILFVCAYNCVK